MSSIAVFLPMAFKCIPFTCVRGNSGILRYVFLFVLYPFLYLCATLKDRSNLTVYISIKLCEVNTSLVPQHEFMFVVPSSTLHDLSSSWPFLLMTFPVETGKKKAPFPHLRLIGAYGANNNFLHLGPIGHMVQTYIFLFTHQHSMVDVISIMLAAFTFAWPFFWYPVWKSRSTFLFLQFHPAVATWLRGRVHFKFMILAYQYSRFNQWANRFEKKMIAFVQIFF